MADDPRTFFEQLRELPTVGSGEVAAEWSAMARRSEPWRSMPLDDLVGELPDVIAVLLREVPSDRDLRPRALELFARRHGSFRRRQPMAATALEEEVRMLGDALGAVLRRAGASAFVAEGVVTMMGRELHLVRRAVCAGYLAGPSCERR